MTLSSTPRPIHLVGSVPLSSAEDVFRATSEILGARLKKISDGETGRRKNWINFQYAVLARNPMLEFAGPPVDLDAIEQESDGQGADYAFSRLRLRSDAVPAELSFSNLGYAANALSSYEKFAELKRRGAIGQDVRFQVSLPTPLAPVAMFVVPENIMAVYPRYSQALMAELAQVTSAIPAGELAIQWDVAVEIGLWEGLFPRPPGDWKNMLLTQLAGLSAHVPEGVLLGYHLCYGDRGHKHFIEPKDLGNLVEIANGLGERVQRPLNWLHVPVPRERHDAAYFEPLAGWKRRAETQLFLGLVHLTDGVEGARRRIEAASQVVSDFGIGTECGFGRRDPRSIPALLSLHAAIDG